MDRELVLAALIGLVAGPLAWTAGAWPAADRTGESGRLLERKLWRRIWLPLLPAGISLSVLAGWALFEPENAEPVPWPLLVTAGVFTSLWLRAALRALCAGIAVADVPPAVATVGLFRPRVVVSPRFIETIDDSALAAAMAHEEAHLRHRDPLRIWLAAVATDLQWPWPTARARLRAWLRALEVARDDEARQSGVDGENLAAAILAAVQLTPAPESSAGLTGDGIFLRERIERLLGPLPADTVRTRARLGAFFLLFAFLASGLFGAVFGESVVCGVLLCGG